MQRYINTLPVFEALARKEAAAAARAQDREGSDPSGARTALANLAELCKRAQAEVAEKLPVVEQVFADPGLALRAFIERLFEGHVEVRVPHARDIGASFSCAGVVDSRYACT